MRCREYISEEDRAEPVQAQLLMFFCLFVFLVLRTARLKHMITHSSTYEPFL